MKSKRSILALLLLCLAVSARAGEWKSELYHCAATIPDSAGWQMIDAPPVPGIAPVLVMQNTARSAVFGINVIEKYRDANLADPAIQKDFEAMLRQFGYQFVGHANVKAGGFDWLQYPVRAGVGPQQVSGVIRYAAAGGYVFSITMLRGGGKEAAQDVELQRAAASFRILPASAFAAAPAAQVLNPQTAATSATPVPAKNSTADKPEAAAEEPADGADDSQKRLIWYGVAGVIVLLFFFGIIGSGRGKKG
jgi:hypothetical protein